MDNLTITQRRKNMQNIRSAGTAPEKKIIRALKKKKIYFARNVTSLCGKPDIVFRKLKIAVFIDSDFWHGHPKRFQAPKTNRRYWREKIKRNKLRDREVNRELKMRGWKVFRYWEYDIRRNFDNVFLKLLSTLKGKFAIEKR